MEKDLNSKVVKNFTFESFDQALIFVNRVGSFFGELRFFPDLDVDFNKVKITFNSLDKKTVDTILSKIKLQSLEQ